MNFNQHALYYRFTIIALLVLTIPSCKKEEGYGGKATIRGTVIERIYDKDFTTLQSESPDVDKDVYIEFGNSQTVGDNVKTSANGKFEFNYLLPGKYFVYIYSEDSLNRITNNNNPIVREINISSGDETFDMGNIIKYKTVNFDDGSSIAKGVIGVRYFSNGFKYNYDNGYAKDHDVYLIYNNRPYSETRIRTLFDGTYVFPNLIKGNYKIYTFSDSANNIISQRIREFKITEDKQVVQIDSISVNIETNYKL